MNDQQESAAEQIRALTLLLEEAKCVLEQADAQRRETVSITESYERIMTRKCSEVNDMESRLVELERTAQLQASAEYQLGAARAEINRLATENVGLKQEIKSLMKEISNLGSFKHQAANLNTELDKVRQELAAAAESKGQLEEQLSEAHAANKELTSMLSASTDKLTAMLAIILARKDSGQPGNDGSINVNVNSAVYQVLRHKADLLDAVASSSGPSSSKHAPPLATFILCCNLISQQVLLQRLAALVETMAEEQTNSLDQSSFYLAAFSATLASYYIDVFINPAQGRYCLASDNCNPDTLTADAAHILSTGIQDTCGSILSSLEESVLIPAHDTVHTELTSFAIKGLFARLVPVILSSMDRLQGIESGPYTHTSFITALLPVEKLMYAAVSYTTRAVNMQLKDPLAAFSARNFNNCIMQMSHTASVSANTQSACAPLSTNQAKALLNSITEQLSQDGAKHLKPAINELQVLLGDVAEQEQEDIRNAARQLPATTLLLALYKATLHKLENYNAEQHNLRSVLEQCQTALSNLQSEHSRVLGLLKISSDRTSVAEENSLALRHALSAKLLA